MQNAKIGQMSKFEVYLATVEVHGHKSQIIDLFDRSGGELVCLSIVDAIELADLLLEAVSRADENPPGLIGG